MFVSIDSYYDIQFYNECKEALKNNGVPFKEYISTKPPYEFYIEVEHPPTFVNYDEANSNYSKWLVNIVMALKPNDDYIYMRRDSYTNIKAIQHYAVNDALNSVQQSGEGIFFTMTKEEVLKLSRDYPRKIYYMGKYYNNKFRLFLADHLIIRNFLTENQILAESKAFKHVTELEVELNFKVFREKDRLVKLSETPYVLNGRYHDLSSVRPEISGKYVLS